ncbi:MAG: hypothetical protein ACLFVT_01560 [Syntrophobacteria bacterium]
MTVKLVKAPEMDIEKIKTVGVLPFKSPDQSVGCELAEEIVKRLNRGQSLARMLQPPGDIESKIASLQELGERARVKAVLLGEITEYSVQVSKGTACMMAAPEFGTEEIANLGWVFVNENPAIKEKLYYYRIKALRGPSVSRVPTSRLACGLRLHLRLIGVESGTILWEEEIARHLQRLTLSDEPVNTEGDINKLQASIVDEVADRLRPQESTVKRMFKVPRLFENQEPAKLVRQGIQAAARDNWSEAERLFLEAAELAPNECCIKGNLGLVYEKTGRYLEAVAAYERAYRCQPLDPTYRYYSDDLQTAFVPDLRKDDLPTLVLAVRGDGLIYLDGGKDRRRHPGDNFILYRTQVRRDPETYRIKATREMEFARGEIIEVRPKMSLGRVTLLDSGRRVRRGDMVRFPERH